jgi:hypothetical protein
VGALLRAGSTLATESSLLAYMPHITSKPPHNSVNALIANAGSIPRALVLTERQTTTGRMPQAGNITYEALGNKIT